MSTTANYVKEINIPQNYSDYYEELSKQVYKEFETAADAKSTLLDSSGIIEPKIAFDLAERVQLKCTILILLRLYVNY